MNLPRDRLCGPARRRMGPVLVWPGTQSRSSTAGSWRHRDRAVPNASGAMGGGSAAPAARGPESGCFSVSGAESQLGDGARLGGGLGLFRVPTLLGRARSDLRASRAAAVAGPSTATTSPCPSPEACCPPPRITSRCRHQPAAIPSPHSYPALPPRRQLLNAWNATV